MKAAISGPAVRAAREAAKLSQNSVAQALGMNRMYYSLFEAGRYILDDNEHKTLREFLESRDLHLVNDDTEATSKSPRSESDTPAAESDQASTRTGEAEDRTDTAKAALSSVQVTARATGLDSKRTAAAVATAAAALQVLDYAELLAVGEELGATLEGLADEPAFAEFPINQKLLWESRAAGMLICSALYGDAWHTASCDDLSRVGRFVRKTVADREWDVTDLNDWDWGFFSDHEKHRPEFCCQLARHIAKAAEQRRAPNLTAT